MEKSYALIKINNYTNHSYKIRFYDSDGYKTINPKYNPEILYETDDFYEAVKFQKSLQAYIVEHDLVNVEDNEQLPFITIVLEGAIRQLVCNEMPEITAYNKWKKQNEIFLNYYLKESLNMQIETLKNNDIKISIILKDKIITSKTITLSNDNANNIQFV